MIDVPFAGGTLTVSAATDVLSVAHSRYEDLRSLADRARELETLAAARLRAEERLSDGLRHELAMGRIRDQILALSGLDEFAELLTTSWLDELRALGLPVHRMWVQERSPHHGRYQVVPPPQAPAGAVAELPSPLPGYPWVTQAWQSGYPVVVDRQRLEQSGYLEPLVHALVELPFRGGNGSLSVSSCRPDAFGPAAVRALQTFAGLVATALRRLQDLAALRASEAKHRLLTENSHDIIYTLDRQGILTFVSPAWTALLGHPVSEVEGRPFQEFVHPDDRAACTRILQAILTGRHRPPRGNEYRIRHADGSWRWHT